MSTKIPLSLRCDFGQNIERWGQETGSGHHNVEGRGQRGSLRRRKRSVNMMNGRALLFSICKSRWKENLLDGWCWPAV